MVYKGENALGNVIHYYGCLLIHLFSGQQIIVNSRQVIGNLFRDIETATSDISGRFLRMVREVDHQYSLKQLQDLKGRPLTYKTWTDLSLSGFTQWDLLSLDTLVQDKKRPKKITGLQVRGLKLHAGVNRLGMFTSAGCHAIRLLSNIWKSNYKRMDLFILASWQTQFGRLLYTARTICGDRQRADHTWLGFDSFPTPESLHRQGFSPGDYIALQLKDTFGTCVGKGDWVDTFGLPTDEPNSSPMQKELRKQWFAAKVA